MTAIQQDYPQEAVPLLNLLHWAMFWSPLRDDELGEECWQALALPGHYRDCAVLFNQRFVLDYPVPAVSLLLSSALQREAGSCREEWMRIAEYLGLQRQGPSLPPDHLALVCEMLAHGVHRQEAVLCNGIVDRYLQPWLVLARQVCTEPPLLIVLARFERDVRAASTMG